MKRGNEEVKAIYFNVYKNDKVSGNGPTHQWLKWQNKEDIVIPKGTYTVKFFPSSPRNENQGNLKIEPFVERDNNLKDSHPFNQQDQVKGTNQGYNSPYNDNDFLDDDLNRW